MSRLRLDDTVLDSNRVLREAGNEERNEAFIQKVQSIIPKVSPETREKVWDWCSDARGRRSETILPVISLIKLLENEQDAKEQLLNAFPLIAEYVEEFTPEPASAVETQTSDQEKIAANDSTEAINNEKEQTRKGALKAIYSTTPPDRASA